MYSNYPYWSNMNQSSYRHFHPHPYVQHPYYAYNMEGSVYPYQSERQQPVRGTATWTDGGQVTQCGIPWSKNLYMTAAVGRNSPYSCGQTLKIRNLSVPGSKEIIVTVVDQVPGYPANKINLHRKAFEALGATTQLGVINIEIMPSPELEQEKWGKYLLAVTQTAYPGYNVRDYSRIGKKQVSAEQTSETYDFSLQSPTEEITVRGKVIYNPTNDRVISFDLKEV